MPSKTPILAACLVAAAAVLLLPAALPCAAESAAPFETLKRRLVSDGFDPARIEALFGSPGVRFEPDGVAWLFTYSEAKLNYDQFKERASIGKARAYLAEHDRALRDAESTYGVDRHVITAIILVETRLGTYLGNQTVLNTLSTIASLSDPAARDRLWAYMKGRRRIEKQRFLEKAEKKSRWAYAELKSFLEYAAAENLAPEKVIGSLAGAMGIAQFMPSNIVKLGKDGDSDGRVDLFVHEDAIASVANYLRHYGWRPGMDRKSAYKVVLRYNYSKPYANTVLDVADLLRRG
jgi:membrane-bound lytic murein transglycosylase B